MIDHWQRTRPWYQIVTATCSLLVVVGGMVIVPPSAKAQDDGSSTFADAPAGSAVGVTGGGDGPTVWVTTLAADGAGSLRALSAGSSPRTVGFAVSGTIELREPIVIGSNVTIDGRGAAVDISGSGLELRGSTNVIIRNLRIHDGRADDSNLDAVSVLESSTGVWLDHLDLSSFPDGLLDVTQGSTDVTISWSYLHDHGKAMLLGDANRAGHPDRADITVHHNRFENTGERNPMMRHGRFAVINNVVRNWGYDADSGYGMRIDCGALGWVEGNQFDHGENLRSVRVIAEDRCDAARLPALVLADNEIDDPRLVDPLRVEDVPTPQDITAEPLDQSLIDRIDRFAGRLDVDGVGTEAPGPASTADATGGGDMAGGGDEQDGPSPSSRGEGSRSWYLIVGVAMGVALTVGLRRLRGSR